MTWRGGRRGAAAGLAAALCIAVTAGSAEGDASPALAGAAEPQPGTSAEPTTAPTASLPAAGDLLTLLDRWRFSTGTPGVVVGLRLGTASPVVVASGKDAHTGAPIAPDALFGIASITKTFVGALALQLIDEGRLGLDDTIDRYVDFPNAERITVRQLLRHTSGLAPEGSDGVDPSNPYAGPFQEMILANLDRNFTTDEIIEYVRDRPLLFEPGTGVEYSNVNTILLGRVIEVVEGVDLTTALRTRLLEPLELDHTYYEATEDGPRPAPGVFTLGAGATLDTADFPSRGPLSALGAAGAMVSDVDDLLAWSDDFLRAGAIGHDDLSTSRFDVTHDGLGLGVVVWAPSVGGCVYVGGCPGATLLGVMGAGSLPGTNSVVAYFPRWDLTVVALANASFDDVDVSGALVDCLVSTVIGRPVGDYACPYSAP